jgi:hypothetical protein
LKPTRCTRRSTSSTVLGRIIHQSDAEYLEEQVDEGHLLLFVRTRESAQEQRAMEILAKHCGADVRIHSVPDASPKVA